MKSIEEFFEKFTHQLKTDPPKDFTVMSDEAIGDWLAAHFTLDELDVLKKFEEEKGEDASTMIIVLAFQTAGLAPPNRA